MTVPVLETSELLVIWGEMVEVPVENLKPVTTLIPIFRERSLQPGLSNIWSRGMTQATERD